MFTHQQKQCLLRRLFQQLQEFIRTRSIHLLGLPNQHHFISITKTLQRQLTQDLATLLLIDHTLLGLHTHSAIPIIQVKINTLKHHLPEFIHKLITHIPIVTLHNREGKMQVGVLQFLKLQATWTHTARVTLCPVRTS